MAHGPCGTAGWSHRGPPHFHHTSSTPPPPHPVPSWTEPDWGAEDGLNQPLTTFRPVVTARGLTLGASYTLLRFDRAAALPSRGNFLASGTWAEKVQFVASGSVQVVSNLGSISSGGTYFYRCVRS